MIAATATATSSRATMLLGAMRRNFELLVELEKTDPAGVVLIIDALVAHLRSWKPMAATSLPDPTVIAQLERADAATAIERAICADGKYRLSLEDGHLVLILTDEADEDEPDRAVGVLTPDQAGILCTDIACVLKGAK